MVNIKNNTIEQSYNWIVVSIFLALGLFGYLFPAIDWLSATPGDLNDARFNSVILEHLFGWVVGSNEHLWSPKFFFPYENVLGFSDNHFGSALSYILFRLIGIERELAFTGWFITGSFLNFAASFYVTRRLGFSVFSAAAAAFVFTFALPVLHQEGHSQLNYRFPIPFSCLTFWLFLSTRRLMLLGAVIFWVALQFYCSIYLGVFLVFLILGMCVSYLLITGQYFLFSKDQWLKESTSAKIVFIIISFTGAVAISLLLLKYHSIKVDYAFSRSVDEIFTMLPRMSSYILSDRSGLSSWVGSWVTDIPMRHEHELFFGIGVLCVALYGVWNIWYNRQDYDLGRTLTIALMLLFLITISINGFSLYKILIYLPGVGSIRAVTRIVVVMLFPVSILVAIGCEDLLQKYSTHKSRIILTVSLMTLLSSEVLFYKPVSTPIDDWRRRQEELRAQLPGTLSKKSVLFVTQKNNEPWYLAETDGMILAQDNGVSTLNGYSGNFPPGYLFADPCISYEGRLLGYANFRGIPASEIAEISKNVVPVIPDVCPHVPAYISQDTISREMAENINLRISGKVVGKEFQGYVVISNLSKKSFTTVSTKAPIGLSWRFIPVLTRDTIAKLPGWDSRKYLSVSLDPNQSYSEPISISLPTVPGRYYLEVSMVQEVVAWFHNLGMKIPQYEIIVSNSEL